MRVSCIARTWLLIVVAAAVAGCAGGNDGSQKTSPVPTAPAVSSAKATQPKTAALPELPKGAGEMDYDAPKELTPTESGLLYRILRKGGDRKPTESDSVVAHYQGWLDNGKVFDSSYKRGAPIPFALNRVVKGWTEGLQLVGEGGMIELEIPGPLGYPNGAPPDIPPNATLHFIVELKEVTPAK